MLKKPLFIETFVLLLLVGILNSFAEKYHLYWSTNEFDSIVHFFAGVLVAMFFLWFYYHSGFFEPHKKNFKEYFYVAIFGVLFVGIGWEIYELVLGEAIIQGSQYPYDTTLDLIMDSLGGLVALLYGYMKEIDRKIDSIAPIKDNNDLDKNI